MSETTAERVRELLDYNPETGVFTRKTDNRRGQRISDVAGSLHKRKGYSYIVVDGTDHTAARLAWLYMTGHHPRYNIDHINGVKDDNRWTNLRDVSQSINLQNQRRAHSRNITGFLGVSLRRNKFLAQITISGKTHNLGRFVTAEAAHAAYIAAKRLFHPGSPYARC